MSSIGYSFEMLVKEAQRQFINKLEIGCYIGACFINDWRYASQIGIAPVIGFGNSGCICTRFLNGLITKISLGIQE